MKSNYVSLLIEVLKNYCKFPGIRAEKKKFVPNEKKREPTNFLDFGYFQKLLEIIDKS